MPKRETMSFEAMEKFKEGLTPEQVESFNQIESDIKTLQLNKSDAVGESKKYKGVKHSYNELLGLEKDLGAEDSLSKASEIIKGYKEKIDSLEGSASSEQLKATDANAELQEMMKEIRGLKTDLTDEKNLNALNNRKGSFRKELEDAGIKSAKKQDLAIKSYLSEMQNSDNLAELATSIATEYPELTDSAHKGGAGTIAAQQTALAEKEITYGMPVAEEAAILKARREQNI
jgi:hypothetical protein